MAPPCEELDPPYDIKLVFVQKITFVLIVQQICEKIVGLVVIKT